MLLADSDFIRQGEIPLACPYIPPINTTLCMSHWLHFSSCARVKSVYLLGMLMGCEGGRWTGVWRSSPFYYYYYDGPLRRFLVQSRRGFQGLWLKGIFSVALDDIQENLYIEKRFLLYYRPYNTFNGSIKFQCVSYKEHITPHFNFLILAQWNLYYEFCLLFVGK